MQACGKHALRMDRITRTDMHTSSQKLRLFILKDIKSPKPKESLSAGFSNCLFPEPALQVSSKGPLALTVSCLYGCK